MNPSDLAVIRYKPIRQAQERLTKARETHVAAAERVRVLEAELPRTEAADRRARGDALVDGKSPPTSKADRLRAELEAARQQQDDLEDAVNRAAAEIPQVIAEHEQRWFGEGIRELSKAKTRYLAAIEELGASRAALSDEATLAVWLRTHGRNCADAANDVLGGRLGARHGQAQPLSFGHVTLELEADAEHLAAHPVEHDVPHPVADLMGIRRAS